MTGDICQAPGYAGDNMWEKEQNKYTGQYIKFYFLGMVIFFLTEIKL